MFGVKNWFSGMTESVNNKRLGRIQNALTKDAEKIVQVTEFGGELYLSYGGIPLVRADYLNENLPDIVQKSRSVWIKWKLNEFD